MSAAVVELGWEPLELTVNLTRDSDFVQPLITLDGSDFPTGATITMSFDTGASWPAAISGPNASWSIDKAVVNALLDTQVFTARVIFTLPGGTDLVWMAGRVIRHD